MMPEFVLRVSKVAIHGSEPAHPAAEDNSGALA